MPDTVSKTDNFLKAIEKYAEAQRTKIQSEAEDFKEKELNKAEEEGLREAYVLIQKEMTDIRMRAAAEFSKAENASRKRNFMRRREIEIEVFDEVRKKLFQYMETEDYSKFLEKSAKLICDRLDSDDIIIKVKNDDIKYKDNILKIFNGKKCEIQTTDDIAVGGMTGQSRSLGLLIDETLDTRLEEQHEWFCETSGLRVTE